MKNNSSRACFTAASGNENQVVILLFAFRCEGQAGHFALLPSTYGEQRATMWMVRPWAFSWRTADGGLRPYPVDTQE